MPHPLNQPATLCDILEARNYVVSTVLDVANSIISLLLSIAVVLLVELSVLEGYSHWWSWLPASALYAVLWWRLRITPSSDLLRTKAACEAARNESGV